MIKIVINKKTVLNVSSPIGFYWSQRLGLWLIFYG